MSEILTQIILSIIGVVISGVGSILVYYIKLKIDNEHATKVLSGAVEVVTNGVDYVYQTYVQGLKGTSLWDKQAMISANQQAVDYIKNNLSSDMINFLMKNNKDINLWISEQIEIAIKKSKDNKGYKK